MAAIFARALRFISQNKSILVTLLLVVFIPVAFFFNVYGINTRYEKNIDTITQRKAVMIEKLINTTIAENLASEEYIQSIVSNLAKENKEILALHILKREGEEFRIIASTTSEQIGTIDVSKIQNALAWDSEEGIAMLGRTPDERYWNVTKLLLDTDGNKIGLITLTLSLSETDALIQKTIAYSYWILIVTLVIVVLLVANQARLIGHVFTLTKLKEIDKMKDMFISMASHELRSPLTAMKGYTEFLQENKVVANDAEALRYTENIGISIDRLNILVNDILDVSRLEGNRIPMDIKPFDPDRAIAQVVEEFRPQAMQKNLALSFENTVKGEMIFADEDRFKQILVNLIGNAIKYTAKGSVTISAMLKNNMYNVTVADTGFGISSEDQKKLFQKFYRVQNEHTSTIVGTGLGLWITNEIAKRMNGEISVESIEGVGSHFSIQLPRASK